MYVSESCYNSEKCFSLHFFKGPKPRTGRRRELSKTAYIYSYMCVIVRLEKLVTCMYLSLVLCV